MIEKRVIRHKNRRFESKELPSQTALRLRSDKNKRLVPDEEDNVFAAVFSDVLRTGAGTRSR